MTRFHMIDVADKSETLRIATARGRIRLSTAAYAALEQGTNPKGDVLSIAEVTGIMAAKKTPELLPLCHPLSLQAVSFEFEKAPQENSVRVDCTVKAIGRTGVEMEALTGVQGALLCIYDLSKAVDPRITIEEIRLVEKRGGKHGHWKNPDVFGEPPPSARSKASSWSDLRVALLTLSDRASRGEYADSSGPLLKDFFSQKGAQVAYESVIADEASELKIHVQRCCRELKVDIVVTTGGTGLGPRDITPEALESLFDKKIDGFGELLRSSGSRYVSTSWLSRATAGLIGSTLIVSLPGSPKAVREGCAALGDLLLHGVRMIKAQDHSSRTTEGL